MPREQLSELQIRRAKAGSKPRKLFDGGGLYVLVHPNGSRYWRLKYRFAGKERLLALGVYPQVGLAEARASAAEAKRLASQGMDPVHHKRALRVSTAADAANTFRALAEEWIETKSATWSPSYIETVRSALRANLYRQIGDMPVRNITVPIMREALLNIERRGALVALAKTRMWASGVFRYAIATGRSDQDPAAPLRGTFKAHRPKNFAALTKKEEVAKLLAKIDAYDGSVITTAALKLLALTFVRTGELRHAEWREFDFVNAVWLIPAERMKMRTPHQVPLASQAIELLNELRLLTGGGKFLFPNERRPQTPMSENAILYALYRLGYHGRATGHGFRATASTLLNELGYDPDVIERQLAHRESNKVRAAYHRTQYLDERSRMMQDWADFLDRLKSNLIDHRASKDTKAESDFSEASV